MIIFAVRFGKWPVFSFHVFLKRPCRPGGSAAVQEECSRSLMDRISDSGSDGCGSIPHGSTSDASILQLRFRLDELCNLYRQVKDSALVGVLSGHAEGSRAFARYRTIDEQMKEELVRLLEKKP